MSERPKKRLLIVDDDVDLCNLLVLTLRKEPLEIEVTHTAEDFFKRYLTFKPELCLVDLHIHGDLKAGIKVVATIRKKIGNAIPLIVFSREQSPQIITYALEVGANDYLTKPLDPFVLKAKLNHFLNLAQPDVTYRQVPEQLQAMELRLAQQIVAIEEDGLFLRGPAYVAKGSNVQFRSVLLKELDLDECLTLTVEQASLLPSGQCELYLTFPPNRPDISLKVRAWISQKNSG